MTKPKPKGIVSLAGKPTKPDEPPKRSGLLTPKPKPGSESPELASSESDVASSLSDVRPGDVGIEVTPPKAEGPGFLSSLLTLEDGGVEAPKRGRGRPPKAKAKALKLEPEELANLLLVPALLMAAKHFLPEAVHPTFEEATGFCGPLARIITRHMPAVPMSEDAIDLGRMMLAGIAYWMRIQPVLEALGEAKKKGAQGPAPVKEPDDGRETGGTIPEPTNGIITGSPGRAGLVPGGGGPVPDGGG